MIHASNLEVICWSMHFLILQFLVMTFSLFVHLKHCKYIFLDLFEFIWCLDDYFTVGLPNIGVSSALLFKCREGVWCWDWILQLETTYYRTRFKISLSFINNQWRSMIQPFWYFYVMKNYWTQIATQNSRHLCFSLFHFYPFWHRMFQKFTKHYTIIIYQLYFFEAFYFSK